jgi:hypothetical protein
MTGLGHGLKSSQRAYLARRKAQSYPLPIRRYKQGDHYHVTPNITLALSGRCLVSLPPRPDYCSLLFSLSSGSCHLFVLHYFFPLCILGIHLVRRWRARP